VKKGEVVLVKDRNVLVAKIVPFSFTADAELLSPAADGKVNLPANQCRA